MDINNPFGVPSPGQSQNQSSDNAGKTVTNNNDQSVTSSTVIESLKLQKESEERAKKQYTRELNSRIDRLRSLIRAEDIRIAKEYGTYAIGGFFFGGISGFFYGRRG